MIFIVTQPTQHITIEIEKRALKKYLLLDWKKWTGNCFKSILKQKDRKEIQTPNECMDGWRYLTIEYSFLALH